MAERVYTKQPALGWPSVVRVSECNTLYGARGAATQRHIYAGTISTPTPFFFRPPALQSSPYANSEIVHGVGINYYFLCTNAPECVAETPYHVAMKSTVGLLQRLEFPLGLTNFIFQRSVSTGAGPG